MEDDCESLSLSLSFMVIFASCLSIEIALDAYVMFL